MTPAPGGAQLNPIAVEQELRRLSDLLEERTDELRVQSEHAAQAEATYKLAKSRTIVQILSEGKSTADEREARAYIACSDQLVERLTSAAAAESTREACRSLRAQLSALQTLSANHREISR